MAPYNCGMYCEYCDEKFTGRIVARFCSTKCRVYFHRAEKRLRIPPDELTELDRWVRHRSKKPMTVKNRAASSTNPATWASFSAVSASRVGHGFGFVLNGDGIACVDLDHCIVGGVLEPWAQEILDRCPRTFVEISPSGTGLHIFGYATLGAGWRRGNVEAYDRGRYMTVTGKRWKCFPRTLANIQDLIASL